MICPYCGEPIEIGDWPICKDGHVPASPLIIDDTIEGGPRFFDTLGHDDVWIESKSQLRREADRRNLVAVGDRHDRAYYTRMFRQHDERLADLKGGES